MLSNSKSKISSYLPNFRRQNSELPTNLADRSNEANAVAVRDLRSFTSVPSEVESSAPTEMLKPSDRKAHSLPDFSVHRVHKSQAGISESTEMEIWDDQTEKVKTKLLSVWNNMKYGKITMKKCKVNCNLMLCNCDNQSEVTLVYL